MAGGTILAIDLGTSEVRVGLVDLEGRVRGLARRRYPTRVGGGAAERAEQDPEAWWAAIVAAAAELGASEPGASELEASEPEVSQLEGSEPGAPPLAIGVTAHGPTLVAADAEGRPVRPAIVGRDRRAQAEHDTIAAATGQSGWQLGVLPAALWVVRHEPEAARSTRWFLHAWEWLGLRLTGRAAATADPDRPPLDPAPLAALGLDPGRIPEPVRPGEPLGGLTPEAAAALGVPAGTPVVQGLNDGYASLLGAGLRRPGEAVDTGGASGGFAVYVERPVVIPGVFAGPAPLPGLTVIGGAMAATGRALDWLREEILGGASLETLLAEAAAVPPGAEGLVFLPYLAGERSPIWDPSARGAFVGLTLGHRRGHLVRAVLEAAAFAIRHVAEPIVAAGIEVREMRVAGGPARSELWCRIKADATGFPVAVPEVFETALLGSAILAATGVGAYPDVAAAIERMVRVARRLEPDPAVRPTYDAAFGVYRALYPALKPLLARREADGRIARATGGA